MTGFYTLVRAHDHVWLDRSLPFGIRREACRLLWALAMNQPLYPVGSASTAEPSQDFLEQADAVLARQKQ